MSEYFFESLPKDLVDELAKTATSIIGQPDTTPVQKEDNWEGAFSWEAGEARVWQKGEEDEIVSVMIYPSDTEGRAYAYADGIDPDSPLGKLCQAYIDQGYEYKDKSS